MIYLLVALGFMFFAGLAMTINEGLWNNTILLICIIISGLTSVAAGVPLGVMILEQAGQDDANAWYFVFVGMWAAFILSLLLLRILTEKASKVRVRFLPIVDKIGGILMSLAVAVMLTSFAASTLLNAPIKAEVWKINEASDSQKSFFLRVAGPFFSVSKPFVEAEGIDSSLFVNK